MSAELDSLRLHRVLVVDDNVAIHGDFRKVLQGGRGDRELDSLELELFGAPSSHTRGSPFALTCIDNGRDALVVVEDQLHLNKPFHLAFVDMRMPGWDGLETIERLLGVQPDLEVVICSAYMDYSWHEVLKRIPRPGLRLLRKPFASAEALEVAHELCARAEGRSRAANS
jgi:CheY-like chemotaxis protein